MKGLMLKLPVRDTETGFKFFRREKLLELLEEVEDKGWFWDTEVMARACARGWRIKEIPCLFVRRFDKVSSVSGLRDSVEYFRKLMRFRKKLREEYGGLEAR